MQQNERRPEAAFWYDPRGHFPGNLNRICAQYGWYACTACMTWIESYGKSWRGDPQKKK